MRLVTTETDSGEAATVRRQRKRRGEGSQLRLELMDAAMRVLDRSPAGVLSLRMVAREAGVAAPSVYAHFPDARSLVAEVVRECWLQLGAEMTQASKEAGGGDAFTDLKTQIRAFVRYAMARPSRYQLLFALEPLDTEGARDLPGLVQPAYRSVLACIERMIAEGRELPASDAYMAAMTVLSLVHGRIALSHTAPHRPRNTPAGVEEFVMGALDRLFPPPRG